MIAPSLPQQSRWFSVHARDNGDEYLASTGDEVLVVALIGSDESDVLLTVEPSAAFDEPALLLPGGEASPELTYEETANRELQEEVGYRAARLDFLGELRPWAKYLAVRSFVYLARDLTPSKLPGDEQYEIGVERAPLSAFEPLIAAGRLKDARVIAALYMARARLQSKHDE